MISVIVIGKNEQAHLSSCFESIERACRHLSHEILYVDSGSTDKSLEIAGSHARCFLLCESRPTPGLGREIGTGEAKGEWLLFLDGDMQLCPGFLEKAMMHAYTSGAEAMTGIRRDLYYDAAGRKTGENPNYYQCHEVRICPEFGGALFIRREALLRAGGWCGDTVACEEQELYARLLKAGIQVAELPVDMIINTDCQRDARSPFSVIFSRRRLGEGEAFRCAMHAGSLSAYLKYRQETFRFYEMDLLCLLLLIVLHAWGIAGICLFQCLQIGYFLSKKRPRAFVTQKIFFLAFPFGLLSYRRRSREYQAMDTGAPA